MMTAAMKFKDAPSKKSYDKPRQHIKKQRQHFANKRLCSQSYGSHVQMWELYHKEDLALKNWCFWVVVLGKSLESPLDSQEIKPVNPKGNQYRIVLPVNIQDCFSLGWTGLISLKSKGLSRVFSNSTNQKHQLFGDSFLYSPMHIHTWLLEKS